MGRKVKRDKTGEKPRKAGRETEKGESETENLTWKTGDKSKSHTSEMGVKKETPTEKFDEQKVKASKMRGNRNGLIADNPIKERGRGSNCEVRWEGNLGGRDRSWT